MSAADGQSLLTTPEQKQFQQSQFPVDKRTQYENRRQRKAPQVNASTVIRSSSQTADGKKYRVTPSESLQRKLVHKYSLAAPSIIQCYWDFFHNRLLILGKQSESVNKFCTEFL